MNPRFIFLLLLVLPLSVNAHELLALKAFKLPPYQCKTKLDAKFSTDKNYIYIVDYCSDKIVKNDLKLNKVSEVSFDSTWGKFATDTPNGDLVFATESSIVKVAPNGTASIVFESDKSTKEFGSKACWHVDEVKYLTVRDSIGFVTSTFRYPGYYPGSHVYEDCWGTDIQSAEEDVIRDSKGLFLEVPPPSPLERVAFASLSDSGMYYSSHSWNNAGEEVEVRRTSDNSIVYTTNSSNLAITSDTVHLKWLKNAEKIFFRRTMSGNTFVGLIDATSGSETIIHDSTGTKVNQPPTYLFPLTQQFMIEREPNWVKNSAGYLDFRRRVWDNSASKLIDPLDFPNPAPNLNLYIADAHRLSNFDTNGDVVLGLDFLKDQFAKDPDWANISIWKIRP